MPNWCANNVTLRHADPAMIDRAANSKGLLMEFLPTPKDLLEGEGWYNWNIKNWGTKWDVDLENIERVDENTLTAVFDSAWSPPIEAYNHMVEMGFEIEAHYYEPGIAFFGTYTGAGDEVFEDTIDFSSMDAETIRTEFPEADERWNISEWLEECHAGQEE